LLLHGAVRQHNNVKGRPKHQQLTLSLQASEKEEACVLAQAAQKELEYAKRKLSAELDTVRDTARATAERDHRMLLQLRQGLEGVSSFRLYRIQGLVWGLMQCCMGGTRVAVAAMPSLKSRSLTQTY
jgi:hypothetical protein